MLQHGFRAKIPWQIGKKIQRRKHTILIELWEWYCIITMNCRNMFRYKFYLFFAGYPDSSSKYNLFSLDTWEIILLNLWCTQNPNISGKQCNIFLHCNDSDKMVNASSHWKMSEELNTEAERLIWLSVKCCKLEHDVPWLYINVISINLCLIDNLVQFSF